MGVFEVAFVVVLGAVVEEYF